MTDLVVDIFDVALKKKTLEGHFTLDELSFLKDVVLPDEGQTGVDWKIEGLGVLRGLPAIRMTVDVEACVRCWRCLGPVQTHETNSVILRLASTPEAVTESPLEDDLEGEEVTLGSTHYNVREGVEEEALLILQEGAAHDDCEPLEDEEPLEAEEPKQQPFKDLAALLKN